MSWKGYFMAAKLAVRPISELPASALASELAQVKMSEIISALSLALDITEGQPQGHAARSCFLGMRIGKELGLGHEQMSALFYALLLKDLGCSSNAAKVCNLFGHDDREVKRGVKTAGTSLWDQLAYLSRHVAPDGGVFKRVAGILRIGVAGPAVARELIQTRCSRGSDVARLLMMPAGTADAIRCLDEHWDGRGHPVGLRGDSIPLLARILCISQTVEVFLARDGLASALRVAKQRSGSWFDPALVRVVQRLAGEIDFWAAMTSHNIRERLTALEPQDHLMMADEQLLDRVGWAFAQVVDAKSPWTQRHSEGVSKIAVGIGQSLGLHPDDLRMIRRAGLLHDIGKLGVSNTILDKPGKLTDEERAEINKHPAYSQRILEKVGCFAQIAELGGSHHERIDGKGYYRGLSGSSLCVASRVMVVSDVFEALTANRPYRPTMSQEKVLEILDKDSGTAFCPEAVAALKVFLEREGYTPRRVEPAAEGSACPVVGV